MSRQKTTCEFADSAYEDAMDNSEDRLSEAICEYMEALRERAFAVEERGGDAMLFMQDLHNNIQATLMAGL